MSQITRGGSSQQPQKLYHHHSLESSSETSSSISSSATLQSSSDAGHRPLLEPGLSHRHRGQPKAFSGMLAPAAERRRPAAQRTVRSSLTNEDSSSDSASSSSSSSVDEDSSYASKIRPAGSRRRQHHRHRHSPSHQYSPSRHYSRHDHLSSPRADRQAAMRSVFVRRPSSRREADDRWPASASSRPVSSHERVLRSSRDFDSPSSSRPHHRHRRHHSIQDSSPRRYTDRERERDRDRHSSRRTYGSEDVYSRRLSPRDEYADRPPPPPLERSKSGSYRRSSWFQPAVVERRSQPPPSSTAPLKRAYSISTPQRVPTLDRAHSMRSSHVSDVASSTRRSTSGGILGGIFGRPPPPRQPIKRIECITCLSDDIPITRAARLHCGHAMCNDCLKRIFELSVTDPQHMPPKCCTAEHIPLKHVDRLFSARFKMAWNKKYQEYTTKNRIYCPSRGCGEWIKPGNIHIENGRKCARCQRCRTKVCCRCNGKWHVRRECPNDEETNRLVETAKREGWQRCFNCRAMVELKEGCNHMTCRCRAEFCMICGSKWKTCNCPWFNYENAVIRDGAGMNQGPDALNHMVPIDAAPTRHRTLDGPGQLNYEQELAARRQQEASDEALARRLASFGFAGDRGNADAWNVMTGPYSPEQAAADAATFSRTGQQGGAWGLWGASGGRRGSSRRGPGSEIPPPPRAEPELRVPPPPPPSDYVVGGGRAAERVVPPRVVRDYASEAGVHMPEKVVTPVKLSEIAGVTRGPRQGRVDAWLNHVEPGIAVS